MPSMPREKSKSTKIAFALLGVPSAIVDKRTARQKKVDGKLLYDNTQRVR